MKKLLTVLLGLTPLFALAHEGHSIFHANELVHYFATPEHGLPLLAILVTLVWVLFRRYRKAVAKIN